MTFKTTDYFDLNCQKCPRLAGFLGEVKTKNPTYHCKPVSPFGDIEATLLIVGLAPGMHGANASGRPFTGDYAGLLLYQALYDFGFSNQPSSTHVNDGLILKNARITNAVKCLPPQNKPTPHEINECNHFLANELASLPKNSVILTLGSIAHQSVLKALNIKLKTATFGHNQTHRLANGYWLVNSYHTSRYNVQTKRLTPEGFNLVFQTIISLLTP